MRTATLDPRTLLPEQTESAAGAVTALMEVMSRQADEVSIASADAPDEQIVVPTAAFELFIQILREMARGNGVTVIPVEAELTTQQAADLMNVSRPFVIKLIDEGGLPARTVGNRRRILLGDLLAYKELDDSRRRAAVDELAQNARELGLS